MQKYPVLSSQPGWSSWAQMPLKSLSFDVTAALLDPSHYLNRKSLHLTSSNIIFDVNCIPFKLVHPYLGKQCSTNKHYSKVNNLSIKLIALNPFLSAPTPVCVHRDHPCAKVKIERVPVTLQLNVSAKFNSASVNFIATRKNRLEEKSSILHRVM